MEIHFHNREIICTRYYTVPDLPLHENNIFDSPCMKITYSMCFYYSIFDRTIISCSDIDPARLRRLTVHEHTHTLVSCNNMYILRWETELLYSRMLFSVRQQSKQEREKRSVYYYVKQIIVNKLYPSTVHNTVQYQFQFPD